MMNNRRQSIIGYCLKMRMSEDEGRSLQIAQKITKALLQTGAVGIRFKAEKKTRVSILME